MTNRCFTVEDNIGQNNRSPVASFWFLTAMSPEGSTRAEILPSCRSLDRKSREAGVEFESQTFGPVN
ncbi:hypothetical protein T265_07228 [Opisthorchis viverrini]|uniref:Uncharacterized protein n=1 Tax=Opisthorchis viverrini TaxID=6198 RepID=A0A074ZPP3_OPIVI|nr:hypothetical protein T265_07228 [Opisthorchis viverrini]KER25290.1 hypothetical protein T265_07228 [Opisthorchis viverrini]